MTPNSNEIQNLKTKLDKIEALRDVTEYELYSARLHEFLEHVSPINFMSKCRIKHNKKISWVADIEFDCLGQGMFKLYKQNSNGSISNRWHGKRYYLNELDFNT